MAFGWDVTDWTNGIAEWSRRLPLWVRLAVGVVGAGLLVYAGVSLAKQAMVDTANAAIVGAVLAVWVAAYIVIRGRTRK